MSEKDIRSALRKVCEELDLDVRCRAATRGVRSALFPLVLGAGLATAVATCGDTGDDDDDGAGGTATASTGGTAGTGGTGTTGGASATAGAGGVGATGGGVVGGGVDLYMAPDPDDFSYA